MCSDKICITMSTHSAGFMKSQYTRLLPCANEKWQVQSPNWYDASPRTELCFVMANMFGIYLKLSYPSFCVYSAFHLEFALTVMYEVGEWGKTVKSWEHSSCESHCTDIGRLGWGQVDHRTMQPLSHQTFWPLHHGLCLLGTTFLVVCCNHVTQMVMQTE